MSDASTVGELAMEHGNRTRRLVMGQLKHPDYRRNIAIDLDKTPSTIQYHLDQLLEDNLIEQLDNKRNKIYYKLTEQGKAVLGNLNTPAQ